MKWTTDKLWTLHESYDELPLAELAALLGCSEVAVKTMAKTCGLKRGNRRPYTAEERARVAELFATHSAAQINALVFRGTRTLTQIYRCAARQGLPRKTIKHTPETIERIRALHGEGLTDMGIALRVGIDRRTVSDIRANRLNLPVNQAAIHEAQLRAIESQRRTLGIRHGGDLRAYGYRKFARENGWPEDLAPREVQILNVLASQGPMTGPGLHLAIGMSPDQARSKKWLKAAGPNRPTKGGSYTADLLQRGLIVALPRWDTTRKGKGNSRLRSLYMLSTTAVAIVDARGAAKQEELKHAV